MDEVRRQRQLGTENARLKKMLAERDLNIDVIKEIAAKKVSTGVRRMRGLHAIKRGVSQRRNRVLLSVSRSALGYVSRLDQRDQPLFGQMRQLPAQYPRYGYWRIRIFSVVPDITCVSAAPGDCGTRRTCRCPPETRFVALSVTATRYSEHLRPKASGLTTSRSIPAQTCSNSNV